MNKPINIYDDQSIETLVAIIDSLALASRVGRHSGFRVVYFGDSDKYREHVRHLIQNRLCNESFFRALTSADLDMLVDRFVADVAPVILNEDLKKRLHDEIPELWSAIVC